MEVPSTHMEIQQRVGAMEPIINSENKQGRSSESNWRVEFYIRSKLIEEQRQKARLSQENEALR